MFLTRTSDWVVVMKFVVIFCIDVIFHAQKRTRANKGGRGGGQNSGILSEHTFWMPSFGYWPVLYFQSDSSQCNLWYFLLTSLSFIAFHDHVAVAIVVLLLVPRVLRIWKSVFTCRSFSYYTPWYWLVLLYCQCYGFERMFFILNCFLPFTHCWHLLSQPTFTKTFLKEGNPASKTVKYSC